MKRYAINFDCENCGHNPVWIDTDAPKGECYDSDQLTCPGCGACGWVSVDEGEAFPNWDDFTPGMIIVNNNNMNKETIAKLLPALEYLWEEAHKGFEKWNAKCIDLDDKGIKEWPDLPNWIDAAFKLQVLIPDDLLNEINDDYVDQINQALAESATVTQLDDEDDPRAYGLNNGI